MNISAGATDAALDDVRREIDAIDDGICDLLERRFAAVEKVRLAKPAGGSPIRPAREAAIVKRLVGRPGRLVPGELKVRLWRAIISAATLSQAPVTLHLGAGLAASAALRMAIGNHFGPMPVAVHADDASALAEANDNSGGLCVFEPGSAWADAFVKSKSVGGHIIGCLPFLREHVIPDLLIFGHAKAEATGDDETVVVTRAPPPSDLVAAPSWQIRSGGYCVSCVPGFVSDRGGLIAQLTSASLDPKIAGRYPSPIACGS